MNKILVVDDSRSVRNAISSFLKTDGYDVEVAEDVFNAKNLLKNNFFDIVISDIVLPEISGVELMKFVKNNYKDTEVILITSQPTIKTVSDALHAKAFDYITKPISKQKILDVVKKALNVTKDRLKKYTKQQDDYKYQKKLEMIIEEQSKMFEDSNDKWKFVLEEGNEGVWDWNIKIDKLYYYKKSEEILGYNENELNKISKGWEERIHPDDLNLVISKLNEHLNSKTSLYQSEHRIKCKEGSYKWILNRGKVIEWSKDKKPMRMIGTFFDITKEKIKSIELNKLYQVVKQSPISIIITDLQGKIEYVNNQFVTLTGYTQNEAKGKSPNFLKTDHHQQNYYEDLWKTISKGDTWVGIFKNKKKDGSFFWERAKISSLWNKNGKIVNYIAFKEDVSNEKELEEQLFQVQKLDSIGKLTGGIAHDFNNLLTVMMGYSEIAKLKIGDNKAGIKSVDMIVEMIKKASSLTHKLLAFSRKETIKTEIININDTFKDFLKILHRIIGEDIQIKMNLDNEIALIEADLTQIEQIIMNMFINARDAINCKTDIAF